MSDTLLLVAVCVLTIVIVGVCVVGARVLSLMRARSRQINAQIEELGQRLDAVDRDQEALHERSDRLREDVSTLGERLDEVERAGLERYQAVLDHFDGLHRDVERLEHRTQHGAALDRAEAEVARAVADGRLTRDTGARLQHHLAEVRSTLLEEETEAEPVEPPPLPEAP